MSQRARLANVLPALPALALLALAVLAAACAAYRHQHAPMAVEERSGLPPARPASDAFKSQKLDAQLAEARGEVQAVKRRLREEGKYDCCVMPACNQCLLQSGECHCRRAVEEEQGPCCGECTEAWLEGRGMVEGVDPWELLERKKKQQQEGGEQPPAAGEKPPAGGGHGHDGHHHVP